MGLSSLRETHLIRPPFLQSTKNVFLCLGSPRIQHLCLDVDSPLIVDVDAFVQYSPVRLEHALLFVRQDINPGLLLNGIQE